MRACKRKMNRFYVFWFFFCAGWGYLMAQPIPNATVPQSLGLALASFPISAVTFFLILAIDVWRSRPRKLTRPSFALKPWNMPAGGALFVLVTFAFAGVWGILVAAILDQAIVVQALQFFLLGLGGLVGVWSAYYVFPSRFTD